MAFMAIIIATSTAKPGDTLEDTLSLKAQTHGIRQNSFKATVQSEGATRVSDQQILNQR